MNLDYNHYGYKEVCDYTDSSFPPQHQKKIPGLEYLMKPLPIFDDPNYISSGKLKNKVAIVTGGDSGIGRAIAVLFAREGAKIVISYYDEDIDAEYTKNYIENLGGICILVKGDIQDERIRKNIISTALSQFGTIDILINNAGIAFPLQEFINFNLDFTETILETNFLAMFELTLLTLPYLKSGNTIINTASSSVYTASPPAPSYVSSKGAVVSFTRSLSLALADKNIRVNAVAPGSTWTPILVTALPLDIIETLGMTVSMKRAAQPVEIARTYLYLASNDSSYVTGQVLHVDGGITANL